MTIRPIPLTIVAALFAGAVHAGGSPAPAPAHVPIRYHVSELDSLGGTISRGNGINNLAWVAGYSRLAGNARQHAALWLYGLEFDLGTLGGPNSNIPWPSKNVRGLLAGIAQTSTPDPLGENWSCSAFFPAPDNTGYTCQAVAWEWGVPRALPTLGGNNGFAAGANNRGQITGWAENAVHDPTCVAPQVLQFRPVVWGPGRHQVRALPLLPGDTSGAATAINDRGQAVGISGICDQAIGRHTARHAVLWENGGVRDIGNLGGSAWHTPMAINQRGDVVGFSDVSGDTTTHAFLWTRQNGIQDLGTLPGHGYSEAHGINERRQIVGISCALDGAGTTSDCRAFVWHDGVMRDLNALVAGYDGTLTTAMDINDLGMITGRALDPDTGALPAFVAVPVLGVAAQDSDRGLPEAPVDGTLMPRLAAMSASQLGAVMHPLSPARARLMR